MDIKLIEIRDRGTLIPALAIRCSPANDAEMWLLQRAGFGDGAHRQKQYILLTPLAGVSKGNISCDPFQWRDRRTLFQAHGHLLTHFDEIQPGDVIDVEYLLGEVPGPKRPERETEGER